MWWRKLLLKLVFGPSYHYMVRSVTHDPRTPKAHDIDIVVRKDGYERRIEADWVRKLARIVAA